MKKNILFTILFLASVFVVYAKSPKPLDPKTITDPVPLTQIGILVTTDVDGDNKGNNFMLNIFPNYLDIITQAILEKANITLDSTIFLSEVEAGTLDIKFEKLDFGGKMVFNQYSWIKSNDQSPRISLVLGLVVRDDGTIPLTVTIEKDDPKYKPGYVLTLQIPLKVEQQ